MCMHACIYIHICMPTYLHTYKMDHTNVMRHVYYRYTHSHIYTHTYIHIYIHILPHAYKNRAAGQEDGGAESWFRNTKVVDKDRKTHACMYAYPCMYVCIYVNHTYIHTYIQRMA